MVIASHTSLLQYIHTEQKSQEGHGEEMCEKKEGQSPPPFCNTAGSTRKCLNAVMALSAVTFNNPPGRMLFSIDVGSFALEQSDSDEALTWKIAARVGEVQAHWMIPVFLPFCERHVCEGKSVSRLLQATGSVPSVCYVLVVCVCVCVFFALTIRKQQTTLRVLILFYLSAPVLS